MLGTDQKVLRAAWDGLLFAVGCSGVLVAPNGSWCRSWRCCSITCDAMVDFVPGRASENWPADPRWLGMSTFSCRTMTGVFVMVGI